MGVEGRSTMRFWVVLLVAVAVTVNTESTNTDEWLENTQDFKTTSSAEANAVQFKQDLGAYIQKEEVDICGDSTRGYRLCPRRRRTPSSTAARRRRTYRPYRPRRGDAERDAKAR